MIQKRNKKYSISTKIFISIITLVIAILASLTIVFNAFMKRSIYINYSSKVREVSENLNHIIMEYGSENLIEKYNTGYNFSKGEQKNKNGKIREEGTSMALDSDYNMMFTLNNSEKSVFECEEVVSLIKSHIVTDKREYFILESDSGTYYLISMSGIDDPNINYIVSFIDITSIMIYSKSINVFIAVTIFLAIVISIFISRRISKNISNPIFKLSDFAKQIGQGKFEQCKIDFNEKELCELAEIMNKSVQYLEKYDKEQKIFFQNASHELRTPLMSIKGYAEAIKYNMIDSDEAVDIIMDEGNRLEELIEELIYVSKMDNITKDYVPSEVDLRELLSQCAIKEKPQALKKNVEFVFDFDNRPVLYKCDEKSLYRAFLNIVDNGVRYAESTVKLTCKKSTSEITIIIENDGENIKEENLSHIFERFYKGPKGRNGIGLSIVKTVIDSHKGKIQVLNKTNKGVEFIITLPI